jgi:undecaprenyl-diphosphatase
LVGVLAVITIVTGFLAAFAVSRWPRIDPTSPAVAQAPAHLTATQMERHRGLRRVLARRLDPAVATGLLLTVALLVAITGAVVLAVLAALVERGNWLVTTDRAISSWVNDHTTPAATHVLQVITQLGATELVVPAAVVVLVLEHRRVASRWILPFLAVVLIGQGLLTNGIKEALDRVRPDLNPAAHLLGPSFPSGHTATAAAFWAAVCLLAGRSRGHRAHVVLAGAAVALGVAVACTRVLLDVHWFSDVLAGLALGWGWFALSSVAFGGRLLRLGAPVEIAERAAALPPSVASGPPQCARSAVGVEHPRVQEVESRPGPA